MSVKNTLQASSITPLRNYYILVAALSFLIYANTLQHGFVLDDIAVIENNRFVQQGIGGIPKILTTYYWQGYWDSNAGLYRPLSLISFAVEHQISSKPFIYHFFNVFYYSLLCCLLLQFLCTIFNKINPRFFLLAVLLFVVHPIHTEVVANIKSRDEIFALLFFLLACRQLYVPQDKTAKNVLLGSVFFLLALLSKEGALALLPLVFLIDHQNQKQWSFILKQRYPLLITAALWLAWHSYIITSSTSPHLVYTYADNSLLATSSVLQQKATALGMFATYIIKAFYPYTLSYDYSFNQIPIISLFSFQAIAALLILLALVYIAFKNINTHSIITFSITLLILPLLLTANLFFNIGATMADRFLFIPTIGSCVIVCWLVYKVFKINVTDKANPSSVQYAIFAILLLFSVQTFTRNRVWQNNYTLFMHDVKNAPNSARVHYNNALALEQTTDASNQQTYMAEYELCLQIDPNYKDALVNLGVIYAKEKQYNQAIALYRRALNLTKNDPIILSNMGTAFYNSQNKDSAIYYLQQAQLAGNKNAAAYNVLGTACFEKQKFAEAQVAFETGLKYDTTNAELYINYGNVLGATKNFQLALDAFLHAYRLNNASPQTNYFIALTYNQLGDTLNRNKFFAQYKSLSKQ